MRALRAVSLLPLRGDFTLYRLGNRGFADNKKLLRVLGQQLMDIAQLLTKIRQRVFTLQRVVQLFNFLHAENTGGGVVQFCGGAKALTGDCHGQRVAATRNRLFGASARLGDQFADTLLLVEAGMTPALLHQICRCRVVDIQALGRQRKVTAHHR